ncbi:MAG: hypothetical protein Q9190_008028, partial [Brigantiaea leucoxantha]
RSSTAETTPISTPKGFDNTFRRKIDKERERDLLFSCYRKGSGFAGNTSSYVDSTLLDSDFEESSFPLFNDPVEGQTMNDRAASHSFMPSRNGALSPRYHQTSNLTSALQSTSGNETRPTPAMNISNGKSSGPTFGHRDSLNGNMTGSNSRAGGGAEPISMDTSNRERPRKESVAGSMVGGMSWGGVSVGSWIRDEYGLDTLIETVANTDTYSIIMEGVSPFPYQSPSFHSSSYLPKMEAQFMKDFYCCGMILPSLHELLQHYEECHAVPPKSNENQRNDPPDSKAAIAAETATAIQQRAQRQQQQQTNARPSSQAPPGQASQNLVTPKAQLAQPAALNPPPQPRHHSSTDLDAVQDMEMDDEPSYPLSAQTSNRFNMQDSPRIMQRSQFGQPSSARVPPLDMNALNMTNHLQQQHQGLRNSTPNTPVASSRNANPYQNNPTVSSVNTPTLTADPMQHNQYRPAPDTAPGTPGELDSEFVNNLQGLDMTRQYGQSQYGNFEDYQFGDGDEMLELCIDEPAKRLFQLNGGHNKKSAKANAAKLGDVPYSENSELARTIREQQRMAGIPDGGSGPNDGIPKPFHCPVIGCEKAYKNQNGLKYHKAHGHNTQQLHSNENGTFSIVDPETLSPYPGTLGMEKHKPFKCDACGKRYKNLNGLKYHKNHSPTCDNDQSALQDVRPLTSSMSTTTPQINPLGVPPILQNGMGMQGINFGLYSNGGFLPGIDEDMIM